MTSGGGQNRQPRSAAPRPYNFIEQTDPAPGAGDLVGHRVIALGQRLSMQIRRDRIRVRSLTEPVAPRSAARRERAARPRVWTPRAIARATVLAATMPSSVRPNSGSTGLAPVAAANTTSPSSRRMHRIDRARHAGLRDHRQPLGLRLGQQGVGDHDRPAWCSPQRPRPGRPSAARVSMSGVNADGRPRPPNSPSTSNGAAQNHGPSPTVTLPTALTTASAATVTPLVGLRGGGAEAALADWRWSRPGRRRRCRARNRRCGAGGRGVAEIAIGREAAPRLVAAVEQIEADRARHDRDHRRRGCGSRGRARQARPGRRRPHRARAPSRRTA